MSVKPHLMRSQISKEDNDFDDEIDGQDDVDHDDHDALSDGDGGDHGDDDVVFCLTSNEFDLHLYSCLFQLLLSAELL